MAQIDEQSRHRQPSRVVAIDMAARQRLAVRGMALPAVLAMFATLVQIYDSVSGKGSLWGAFVSIGIAAWWLTIAAYLSGRRS